MNNPTISVTREMPKYKDPSILYNVEGFWLVSRRDRNFEIWSVHIRRKADRYFGSAEELEEELQGEEIFAVVQIDSLHFAVLTWEEYNKHKGSEWDLVTYAHWARGECGEFGVPVLNEETGEYEVEWYQEWFGEFTPEDLFYYYQNYLPDAEFTQEDAEQVVGKKFKPTPTEESLREERREAFYIIRG